MRRKGKGLEQEIAVCGEPLVVRFLDSGYGWDLILSAGTTQVDIDASGVVNWEFDRLLAEWLDQISRGDLPARLFIDEEGTGKQLEVLEESFGTTAFRVLWSDLSTELMRIRIPAAEITAAFVAGLRTFALNELSSRASELRRAWIELAKSLPEQNQIRDGDEAYWNERHRREAVSEAIARNRRGDELIAVLLGKLWRS